MYTDIKFKNPLRHPIDFFPTQEVRAKGFYRELKSFVLKRDIESCLEIPEHELVLDALNYAVYSSDLIKPDIKKKIQEKKSQDFISTSRLSNWWNGKSIPTRKNKEIIDVLYPGLTRKWFCRDTIIHRFQLHLSTFDLHFIDSKDSEIASIDALNYLEMITEDWRPKDYPNNREKLIIRGPKERLYNSNTNGNLSSSTQEKIHTKYNLTCETSSVVGIYLPDEISEIYQESNFLSIIPYLFCLLSLGEDNNSHYKNDLFIDFLSALNCAYFLLNKKYGGVYDFKNNSYFGYVFSLFMQTNDLYYKNYWSSRNINHRCNKRVEREKARKLKCKNEGIKYRPYIEFSNMENPPMHLSNILEKIINNEIPKSDKRDLMLSSNSFLSVPQKMEQLREYYFYLYKTAGYPEDKITKIILKSFSDYTPADGSDIREYSSTRKIYRFPC